MSIQVLHCSDLHLDKAFNIPSLSRASRRREDLANNFSKIVDYALENKPDLFLITGDVFDRVSPSNTARVFLAQKMRVLTDADVSPLLIGGNHDVPKIRPHPNLAIDVLGSAGLATVFTRSDLFQKKVFKVEGERVCVYGKSYYAPMEGTNPLKNFTLPLEGDYNLLMLHASLRGLDVPTPTPEMAGQNPFAPEDIAGGVHYLALGHFHNRFQREHGGCLIGNPGSIERLSWAEIDDPKGFAWVELNGDEASLDFVDLKTRPMERGALHLSKDSTYSPTLLDHLVEFLSKEADPEKMFKLTLHGLISQDQYGQLRVNELLQRCRDLFFHLVLDRGELEVEGYGRVFLEKVENPLTAFTKRIDTLIAVSPDKDERALLEQVRELGKTYLEASL